MTREGAGEACHLSCLFLLLFSSLLVCNTVVFVSVIGLLVSFNEKEIVPVKTLKPMQSLL